MNVAVPATSSSAPVPTDAGVNWRQAGTLTIGLLAFLWMSDVQGVVLHREEFQTFLHWLRPVLTYAFAAGLVLWHWDFVVRVCTNWRFVVLVVAAVAAIAWASSQRAPSIDGGVSLLRAGERDRLPTVVHPLGAAAPIAWVTPATSHADLDDEAEQQDKGSGFVFDLPAGWTEVPSTQMRPVNLRAAGDARAECYLTSLPGTAGGLLDNINRWRKQMGLDAIDAEALAKLPRTKLLEREAVLVELDGNFAGMGGTQIDNARMLGAIAALPAVTLFLKMTGPRDLVQKERAGFDKILTSLRVQTGAPKKDGANKETLGPVKIPPVLPAPVSGAPVSPAPVSPAPLPPANDAENLRWTVPDGWRAGDDRAMRLVTLNPKATPAVECYVSMLPGAAGGVLDNINRWRGQFGVAAAAQGDVNAWPKVNVLGKEAPLVEAKGTFTGMSGEAKENQALLGAVVPLEDRVVFIKMTGPHEQVQAERERFMAFCRSLTAK